MLTLVAVGITWLSVYNAGRYVFEPIDWESLAADEQTPPFLPLRVHRDMVSNIFQGEKDFLTYIRYNARQSQRNFRNMSMMVVAVFILFGTVGAFVISGQTLKPVKTLAKKIEDIDVNNLDTTLELPKNQDEVSRLTHSFNNMLGKLNRSFESQKLFAQNAAHELKTPLTTLRASIEILQLDDEPTADEYKEVVGIIKTGTDNLIELVEGLLSINSITDEMQWQTFDGKSIFESIISDLREDIAQKSLAVDIHGSCRMKGDKTLLTRALFNLVHNAVRYNIDKGSIKITLAENNIIIEDSGVGIPADSLEHIFQPFYNVDKSRSKKLGGHGLGMAITKNIIEKHKMNIKIFSEVGKGTKIMLAKQ
jgi:signal transduction histidine kinase